MAMYPYPEELVRRWTASNGTPIQIRPIRAEDAEIERAFVNGLSDQAKYYRFFHALNEITPEMLSRFTQIDYDCEMAFIATVGDPLEEREIGVARYIVAPSGDACEFAVVVADDWQGRGVATQLLRSLIESARRKGLARIEGDVLAANHNMVKFAEGIGFVVAPDPDDRSILRIALTL